MSYTSIPADNRILFHRRDAADFGFLSNFHMAAIEVDGQRWPSTEHYYQAQKSLDEEYQRLVQAARTPGEAKRLGALNPQKKSSRKKSWFTGRKDQLRGDWDVVKCDVMQAALEAKFHHNSDLRNKLLATLDAELVEDSRSDYFWGAGEDGSGQNQLGRMLMTIRAQLAADTRTANHD